MPGRSANTGDYQGPDAIVGFVVKAAAVTGGTLRLDVHRVLADDEQAVGSRDVRIGGSGGVLRNDPLRGAVPSSTAWAGDFVLAHGDLLRGDLGRIERLRPGR